MLTKRRICDLLGTKYPILQGGMAWISDASLASAVSNAGGLGIITAINENVDKVREEIRKCQSLTNNPFGVNIMLMSPLADDIAQLVIEEKVQIITTGAGIPSKYMNDWLEAGIKVIPVVASTAVAKRVEAMGASAIIAEGSEAGGHIGNSNTLVLIPQVVDAVSLPVIAAGGIADARGMAAVFMLGAEGIQMGTRFLVSKECAIHENYKQLIVEAQDTDTIVTGRRLGHPVRALKNYFTKQLLEMENNTAVTDRTIMDFGYGSLRKAAQEGDLKMGNFMVGQAAGIVNEEHTVQQIIEQIIRETKKILEKSY